MSAVGVVLAVASFASYAVVFGPMTSVLFMAGLGAHALGHVLAARRYGIAASVRFLPFLGVTEFLEDEPPSRRAMVAIAMAGPLLGGVFALGLLLAGGPLETQAPLLVGAVLVSFNLGNLLPIYPLDGGRIVKAFLFRP